MKKSLVLLLAAAVALSTASLAVAAKKDKSPQKLFERRDINKDGSLSMTEFIGSHKGEQKAHREEKFKKLDADGNNKISSQEFSAHSEAKAEARADRKAAKADKDAKADKKDGKTDVKAEKKAGKDTTKVEKKPAVDDKKAADKKKDEKKGSGR